MKVMMQRKARRTGTVHVMVLYVTLICLSLLFGVCRPVSAAPAEVSVGVHQTLDYPAGESGLIKKWRYSLERKTPGAPLPEGAEGDTYVWSMEGNTASAIQIVAPVSPGSYWYQMRQEVPEGLSASYTTDSTVYDVCVHVGSEGALTLIYYDDGMKVVDPGWTVGYTKPLPKPQKPEGIISAIASALPQTGDMSWFVMGAAALLAFIGVCIALVGRAISRQKTALPKNKGANVDEN
ncbi:hypothetical protein K6V98_01960 [Collinsella sp. AGMB00827]|uniref:Streptococcal pilin isopeptide linker domain-containing protein n=1 Tax=Collinsella ureilytica TaxID=2869515 RepID=A0ABS7MID9_9ACTN|nr:hypothetical protein [Collinsella urealyticum]MBY4797129.1 hypothetical protein [Collinsella urealyticum]